MKTDIQECPVCGAPVSVYEPATEDAHEGWYFSCGGEIYLDEKGRFHAADECRETRPLREAVENMNMARKMKSLSVG